MSRTVVYVPAGVGTFHMESANEVFQQTVTFLKNLYYDVTVPEKILLSPEEVDSYLQDQNPFLVIFQSVTFANGEYINRVLSHTEAPVLLWAVREPVIDGGRLRLNSLTGAFSAANFIRGTGHQQLDFVFGRPNEPTVEEKIRAAIAAVKTAEQLHRLTLFTVGQAPQGFGFGEANDIDLARGFGVRQEHYEVRELIQSAKSYSDFQVQESLDKARHYIPTVDRVEPERKDRFARLYRAYSDMISKAEVAAVASRCWPDFFSDYETPVCAVLSLLNAEGVMSSCEADAYGAISMFVGHVLTGNPVFFGDPVSLDERENTITFWHCGMAACNLARAEEGPKLGVHPNRKIGPTMEFGCQPAEEITIFRVGKNPDGTFRLFSAPGEALDKPRQFLGTSVVVRTRDNAEQIVYRAVDEGWEPHFAVIYGDVTKEINLLNRLL